MSRIIVIGGHGKVALLLAPLLAGAGDQVSAVIRNPAHSDDVIAAGAEPVVADVESLDTEHLAALIVGHDAVVWSAGAGGGDASRTYTVDRDAAIRTIEAAAAAAVPRFVMVSYFGAGPDHGVPDDHSFFAYADAKAAADEHLRGTDLDWTVLGPSTLTDESPTGLIDTGSDVAKAKVSRADVAAVIQATLADPDTIHRTIEFNSGDTPIVEALASS